MGDLGEVESAAGGSRSSTVACRHQSFHRKEDTVCTHTPVLLCPFCDLVFWPRLTRARRLFHDICHALCSPGYSLNDRGEDNEWRVSFTSPSLQQNQCLGRGPRSFGMSARKRHLSSCRGSLDPRKQPKSFDPQGTLIIPREASSKPNGVITSGSRSYEAHIVVQHHQLQVPLFLRHTINTQDHRSVGRAFHKSLEQASRRSWTVANAQIYPHRNNLDSALVAVPRTIIHAFSTLLSQCLPSSLHK